VLDGQEGRHMLSRRRLLACCGMACLTLTVGCAMTDETGLRHGQHEGGAERVPDDVGEWWVPQSRGLAPTVVLIHGGYWQPGFTRHLEDDLAADLCRRGYLVWNIDYRPAQDGWPAPLASAALAYDHLATGKYADRVDARRIAVVGHSAGGQLALWLASRDSLPRAAPGSPDEHWLRPALAVGQAPVAALRSAARQGLGGGAVVELCGGTPQAMSNRYRIADPAELVPAACPVVLIHGRDDDVVPVSQSDDYIESANATNAQARLFVVSGGHFEHLEPGSEACQRLRTELAATLGPAG
jgi:acetyl esterase/lipase